MRHLNVNPVGVDICGDQFMSSFTSSPSVVYDFTPHQRSQRNQELVLTLSVLVGKKALFCRRNRNMMKHTEDVCPKPA
jgi:hypothetical protein